MNTPLDWQPFIDPVAVRRGFAKTLGATEPSQRLYVEACARLVQHLDPIRLEPRRILDLGSGHGTVSRALLERYPRASVISADFVVPRLEGAKALADTAPFAVRRFMRPFIRGRGRGRGLALAADASCLPCRDESFDLVVSSLAFCWFSHPPAVLAEVERVLRPGGLLIFATLGADTLRELRDAWATLDQHHHVLPILDMHDLGDLMTRAHLADVVMDAERITLTYPSVRALLAELHRLEVPNVAPRRPRGMLTPRALAKLDAAYRSVPGALEADGRRVKATLELVHAHAWKMARQKRFPVEIPVSQLTGKTD